jgi:diadenosine tetraphosphate (Ap4A) HIT family hydrolase
MQPLNITQLARENPELVFFEDDLCYVFFNLEPITTGQFKIFPKQAYNNFSTLPAHISTHLFTITNACSTILFEILKAQGTNILIKDGIDAQNNYDRICIETIARFENDKIDMLWQPKQGNMAQLAQIAKDIKSAFILDKKGKVLEKSPNEKISQKTQINQQHNPIAPNHTLSQNSQLKEEQPLKKRKNYWDEQLQRIP